MTVRTGEDGVWPPAATRQSGNEAAVPGPAVWVSTPSTPPGELLIHDREGLKVSPVRASIEVLTVLTGTGMTAPSPSQSVLTGVAEVWIGC